ncbi:VWA domain-containing protein [Mangrovicella endophytica]|uniref:VWA domain-containing protein n=1 Tax=Mangrovicella endophytica TaxID=2066697 RepID=UPI000C9E4977|nr:VWA domain-containing protein [Mangrovicella endophytica]
MWSLGFPYALLLLPLPLIAMRFLKPAEGDAGALIVPGSIGRLLAAGEPSALRARARRLLPSLLWLCLIVALADPRRLQTVDAIPELGRDIVLALDLSGSMEREDFSLDGAPISRLDAVKKVGAAFVRGRVGDRVGVVIFAETAFFAAPLTFDVEAVAQAIESATIGLAGRSTAISEGMGLALKRLSEIQSPGRVIILLSDGANTSGSVQPLDAAHLASTLGIRVHTIALGPQDLETDPKARDAVDSATLRGISGESGGTAFRVRSMADLQAVAETIDQLETSPAARPPVEVYRSFWPWPAGLGFLTALAIMVMDRRFAW